MTKVTKYVEFNETLVKVPSYGQAIQIIFSPNHGPNKFFKIDTGGNFFSQKSGKKH